MRALDLGSGPEPNNFFDATEIFGIDERDLENPRIKRADLAIDEIPFESEFFDYVTAFDLIEHIPRILYSPNKRYPFVELMNEIYRVLKFGGVFYSQTPVFPHGEAWRDPTHVNIITAQTFPLYFDSKNRLASMYGFKGQFEVVSQKWSDQKKYHLLSVLRKV